MEMQRRLNEIELENVFGGGEENFENAKYKRNDVVLLKEGGFALVDKFVRCDPDGEDVYLMYVPTINTFHPDAQEIRESEIKRFVISLG